MADLRTMFGGTARQTFLGVEECTLGDLATRRPHVVVVGVPSATPYPSVGAYCANAPAAIRAASLPYSSSLHHMHFDLGGPVVPAGGDVVDIGDIGTDVEDDAQRRDVIGRSISIILDSGAIPIVLGGDDSVPIPVLGAYAGRSAIDVVQVDAHIDWRDEVGGECLGLSSTMRRTSEMPHVDQIVQVGRRGSGSARPVDVADAESYGVRFFPARQVHREGIGVAIAAVRPGRSTFVTIDIDGLDPSVVPGVIGPEPGGLTYMQTLDLLDGIAEAGTIAGFSLVEFVPENDVRGLGALCAMRLTTHAIGRAVRQRLSG